MADGTLHPFPIDRIRGDFPILRENIHGRPVIYLDNAASTQKPQSVIDDHMASQHGLPQDLRIQDLASFDEDVL